MINKSKLIEKWKRETEKRYEPPIDYRIIFNECVKNCASKEYTLLDIGTGTGKVIFENELFKFYKKVIGIDIEPRMIEICKEKVKQLGLKNVEFYIADSTKKIDFEDESFNVITVMFAPFSFEEVSRLLCRGGYFIWLCGIRGDHKEVVELFPDKVELKSENFEEKEKKLNKVRLKVTGYNILKYKWIFPDIDVLKEFYEKIFLKEIFKKEGKRLEKLKTHNKEISLTRRICTIIARKI